MATKIFISYRRDNAGIYAHLLYQLLKERNYKVFLDIKGLESGLFDEQLLRQIEQCDYFILLLTDGALSRPFVQKEIQHALKKNKKIIPIVDEQFRYPNFLPEPLKRLPGYQSIETNTKDTTQVNYVVQQLQEIYLPKSRSWSKYLFIALIPLVTFGVYAIMNIFSTPSSVEIIPETEQGVTTDRGDSKFSQPTNPYAGDDSQTNSSAEQKQTTKKPEESKRSVPPPQPPPQSNQESLNGSNTTFKANGRIINGSNNEIIGDGNEIHGSNNDIHGNYNRIYGSNNTCYGHGNEFVSGSNNDEI